MLYKIADNIAKYQKLRHMSNEKLAEAIQKSPRQISRIRNGQCKNLSVETLEKIALALDVEAQQLLM